jgi:hypothetical protein
MSWRRRGRPASHRVAPAPAFVVLSVVVLALSGCSSSAPEQVAEPGTASTADGTLPDRSDPRVQTLEAKVAEAVGGAATNLDEGTARCEARLLLDDATGRGAWVRCSSASGGLSSYPVLIEPDGTVRVPQDGEGYPDDVRAMFPPWLARKVLAQDAEVKP